MKTRNNLILTIILAGFFVPGLLLPKIGNLRADCPSSPATPNNQPTNGNWWDQYWDGNGPSTHAMYDDSNDQGGGGGGGSDVVAVTGLSVAPPSVTPSVAANMANGNFVYETTDLRVGGLTHLNLTRYYVSSMGYNGPMGNNFDFNFNRSLELQSGCAYYHTGKGYKIQLNYASGDTTHAQSVGSPLHLAMSPFVGTVTLRGASGEAALAGDPVPFNAIQVVDGHGNRDIFDLTGRLMFAIDRNNNAQVFGRDTAGRLTSVWDTTTGKSIAFTLDTNGRVTAATDSDGRVVSYEYDSYFDLTKVTYPHTADFPSGTTNQYSYDYDGRLSQVIDGKGNNLILNTYAGGPGDATEFDLSYQASGGAITNYSYGTNEVSITNGNGYVTDYYNDGSGNITRKVVHTAGLHSGAPSTYETDWTYDSDNQTTQATYPKGNKTNWTYDSNGDVLSITQTAPSGTSVDSSKGTQALTSAINYTYESRFHQVATVTDPNGNVTTFDHGNATTSPTGNLLSITYPTTAAGTAQATFTYDVFGRVVTATAADGTVTQNTYAISGIGSAGRLIKTIKDYGTGKLNAATQFTYDTYGHIASVEDPNGNTATITTNERDQATEVDGPVGEVVQTTYDAAGNVTAVQKKLDSSHWQKITSIYNSVEQVTSTHVYLDSTSSLGTAYAYDNAGNQISATDSLAHTTSMAYDERNLPYLKTDALGKTVKTDFDANGNTSKLTDELSHVTTYAYDGLDKLEQKTFADSSYQTWKYDAGGRVTSQRTTAGNTISGTYDARNELLTESYGSTITNTYDIMGRLLTATEGGTALTYAYDNLGRNTSFTDQAGRSSTYTYDLNGQRLSATYPTGVVANVAYDALGRPTTLKDSAGATLVTNTYDSLDRVTGVALANSTTVTPSYDLLNRITSVNNTLGSGNRNYSYVYDNASRVTSTTEPRGTIEVTYSNRDEVTGITEPSGSPFSDQSFVFDAAFNRSSWTLGTTTKSYTVNNLNQYTAVASATPTWNTDGGLATYAGKTYTYDALGRLTEADYASGKTLYTYDPFGRRVKKINENTSGTVLSTYQYHYDGSQVAVEYQPSTTWTYYGGIMRTDGTNKQWYYRNAQGSVSAVADNSGNLLEAYEYTAQGHTQIVNGSGAVLSTTAIGNDLTYSGYRYDAETGNFFCNARYYNPALGRFISRDPLDGAEFSQGTNLYAYCGNNSVNATDPSGMASEPGQGMWDAMMGIKDTPPRQGPPAAVSKVGPQSTRGEVEPDIVGDLETTQNWLIGGGSFLIFPEGAAAKGTVTVTRWGREGLQNGDFVMRGGKNFWNYAMSGKWQPGAGNEFASFASGQSFQVLESELGSLSQAATATIFDKGVFGAVKSFLGQASYLGPSL